jgi:hypothetical protein
MSVRVAVSSKCPTVFELEDRMRELLALRRALCLLNASRNRPKGSRRRPLYSARSARGAVCYRSPERRDFNVRGPQAGSFAHLAFK